MVLDSWTGMTLKVLTVCCSLWNSYGLKKNQTLLSLPFLLPLLGVKFDLSNYCLSRIDLHSYIHCLSRKLSVYFDKLHAHTHARTHTHPNEHTRLTFIPFNNFEDVNISLRFIYKPEAFLLEKQTVSGTSNNYDNNSRYFVTRTYRQAKPFRHHDPTSELVPVFTCMTWD